jgi:hypothetical protein
MEPTENSGKIEQEQEPVFDINRPWLSLDQWQETYCFDPDPNKNNFLLCGRQVGKTTAMSIRAVELVVNHYKEGEFVLINSITEKQAYHMLAKAQAYAEEVYPRETMRNKEDKPTKHRLLFKNGAGILCYASGENGEGLRGFTIKKLMPDEGSRMSEEYFIATLPMLSIVKGTMDIASTPFGKHHKDGSEKFFYKCSKDENFNKIYVSAKDCPRHPKEYLEKMKKTLSRLAYLQEFLAEFTDELLRVFDKDWVEKVCCLNPKEIIISSNSKKYLGVDVAGMGKDDCTFEGFQKFSDKRIEQIDHVIERKNLTTETTRTILALHELRKYSGIGVDDGGVGYGVFSELMDNPKTKRRTEALNNASRQLDSDGEKCKKLLKEEMYTIMQTHGNLGLLKLFNIDEIKASLESMQFDEDGRIFGWNSHIAEGAVRGIYMALKDKSLKPFVHAY